MPEATQATVTIKQIAATIAEQHEIAKKQSEAILNDMVGLVTKHLKKGDPHPHQWARHSAGPKARRPDGPQSSNRRGDQDQGEQENRLPRRKGAEGSRVGLSRVRGLENQPLRLAGGSRVAALSA